MCSNHGNIGDSLTAAEKLSAEHEKFSETAKVGYHGDPSLQVPHSILETRDETQESIFRHCLFHMKDNKLLCVYTLHLAY